MTILAQCLLLSFTFYVLGVFPGSTANGQEGQPYDLSEPLEQAISRGKLPGMVAAIVEDGEVIAIGAAGVRKAGNAESLTVDDKLHIGSCTKAMTATLLATLVAEEKLEWSTRVIEVWPSLEGSIHEKYRNLDLLTLLAHRSGVRKDVTWWKLKGSTPKAQRMRLVSEQLKLKPQGTPGDYLYSNVGFAIAGAAAERRTGAAWEKLMKDRLFEPLGLSSAGFGPPSVDGELDQPWGHRSQSGRLVPSQLDNAPSLGPAGTVHLSIRDWAKFASLHLKSLTGKEAILTHDQIDELHVAYDSDKGQSYGQGWIVTERPWASGLALTHSGSNTFWHSTIWLAPNRKTAYLVVTNVGGDDAFQACDEMVGKLIEIHRGL